MAIFDEHGRTISYLRLSVTNRCNLRCRYCTPPASLSGIESGFDRPALLSLDELYRIAHLSAALGMRKIRITGGEPLLRPGLVTFLERVNGIVGVGELVVTTNGMLLSRMAGDLLRAGVKRLNISMDSLLPGRFDEITGGGKLRTLLAGIEAACNVGFPPPQLNVVVMRGFNEDEISAFAALSVSTGMTVRFIEYMPVNGDPKWRDSFFPSEQILRIVAREYRLLREKPIDGAGPARYFKLEGTRGKIGVISPVSRHFCGQCNRLRITADGFARSCLFSPETTDLRPYLRQSDESLRRALAAAIRKKPDSHHLAAAVATAGFVPMSAIGG